RRMAITADRVAPTGAGTPSTSSPRPQPARFPTLKARPPPATSRATTVPSPGSTAEASSWPRLRATPSTRQTLTCTARSTSTEARARERDPSAKNRVSIGRSRESDIFLPDQWLSRHHAEIVQRADGYYVADLQSKNGTLLNGLPVKEERRLREGDVITLGEHTLTFCVDNEGVEEEFEPEGTRVFSIREL